MSKFMRAVLLVAFALSGMTALIYEVVWMRPLLLIFGSTVHSVSTILTTFLLGFAIGSYTFRNLADRIDASKLFAGLQLGIGIYGFIILFLLGIIPQIYLALDVSGLRFLQFVLAAGVIIIPAILFSSKV